MQFATAPRILFAEDDTYVRELVAEALRGRGFEVVDVCDGAEALAMVEAGVIFDALLVDQDMPRLGGVAFLEQVRALGCSWPAVLCSGRDASIEELERVGAVSYIAKPVGLAEICQALLLALAASAPARS